MMDINKTFEAECIDDTIGLTKGKKYVVAQSKEYDKYFVLRNDDEKMDTYRKERFKIVEAEKMEDKIIKIECVNIGNCGSISLGIEYDAIENNKGFRLLSDYNYPKDYFKKVEQQKEEKCSKDSCKNCEDEECRSQFAVINYEEECKKLKEENEDLKERLDNQAESIGSYIKENEKYRDYIKDSNKIFDKLTKENNKELTVIMAEQNEEINQLREEIQQANFKLKEYESKLPQLKELVVKLIRINEILASNIYVEGLED